LLRFALRSGIFNEIRKIKPGFGPSFGLGRCVSYWLDGYRADLP